MRPSLGRLARRLKLEKKPGAGDGKTRRPADSDRAVLRLQKSEKKLRSSAVDSKAKEQPESVRAVRRPADQQKAAQTKALVVEE